MIARLSGILAEVGGDSAVLDVGGVGYLVQASTATLAKLGAVGGQVMLFTEMQVREDAITLYGFGSLAERDWFRLLVSVQGVGGRVALAILSALDPEALHRAIADGDKAMVSRAQGVGAKLALRIVTELKDKAGGAPASAGSPRTSAPAGGDVADAIAALASLGFRPNEASAAVDAARLELGTQATLDALIRLALRKAAR